MTIIEARDAGLIGTIRELFRFRSFYLFLFREISMKKWKKTFLGFWWLIIRPLVPTVMAVVTFTFIVPLDGDGLPYLIFYLSSFITWHLFHATVAFMPRIMLWMRGIMKKTYFPKILVPLAGFGPPLIELLVVAFALILATLYFYVADGVLYIKLGWNLLLLPVCLFLTLAMAVGIGMVTSVMALFIRDIVYSVAYFVQILMFLTPVMYPITFVAEQYRWIIYLLNPMATFVETSRWALTGQGAFDPLWFSISCGFAVVFFVTGTWFFLKIESLLADAL